MAAGGHWKRVAEQVLQDRRPRRDDLLAALDVVNPTPLAGLPDEEREGRYTAKAQLQTRLIERFPNDLELRPDGESWLLALRGGRDAKHLVRSQLGEGAQRWLSEELARHHAGPEDRRPSTGAGIAQERRPAAPKAADPVDEAMEQGDYEGAVKLLAARARSGDADAARQVLELLLDYLDQAEEAARRAVGMPATDTIRALHATALARCGRLTEAEDVLRPASAAEAALAWREIGRAYLAASDPDGARRAADRAVALDPGSAVAADDLRKNAALLVHAGLAGELGALAEALQEARWGDVERLARVVLARDPAHRAARDALAAADRAREHDRRARAFAEAERLEREGRWRDAAARFTEAAQPDRAAAAALRADAADRELRVAAVVAKLAEDLPAGLLAREDLDDADRSALIGRTTPEAADAIGWLDGLPAGKAAARVQAALALLRASKGDHDDALAGLEPHAALLERSAPARRLLSAAREAAARRRAAQARAIVEQADAASDPVEARRVLSRVVVRHLDDAGRVLHQQIDSRLSAIEAREARLTAWRRALGTDPLAALALARGVDGPGAPDRVRTSEAALRVAWRVHDLDPNAPATDLVTPTARRAPPLGLDLERGVCWIAERNGDWLAIHAVPIGGGPVRRGFLLRSPNVIWPSRASLVGDDELAVEDLFSVLRFDVERGVVLGMVEGRRDAWFEKCPAPGGAWHRNAGSWTLRSGASPVDVTAHQLVFAPGVGYVVRTRDDRYGLVEVDGRFRRLPSGDRDLGPGLMAGAVAHPTDPEGLIIAITRIDAAKELVAVTRQGPRTIYRKVWSDGDLPFAASRETGLVYVLEPAPPGRTLVALAPDGSVRFTKTIPTGGPFLSVDREGRRCALVVDTASGTHVELLGDTAPELPELGPHHAHAEPIDECGFDLPPDLARESERLECSEGDAERVLAERMAKATRREQVAILFAFAADWPEKIDAALAVYGYAPGDHPLLAYASALRAQRLRDFRRVTELLSRIEATHLPVELHAHFHHMRASAFLGLGRLDDAGVELAAIEDDECDCPVDDAVDWLRMMNESHPDDAPPDDPVSRSWWELRRALGAGDVHFPPLARCEHDDVVVLRARAVLADPTASFWTRIRALARATGPASDAPLPGGMDGPSRAALIDEIKAWLDGPATASD